MKEFKHKKKIKKIILMPRKRKKCNQQGKAIRPLVILVAKVNLSKNLSNYKTFQ